MLTQLIQTSIALALPFAFLGWFFYLERMISSLPSFKLQICVKDTRALGIRRLGSSELFGRKHQ